MLAADEITLWRRGQAILAEAVTNQSTGYCPDASSWPAVAAALNRLVIVPPKGYTSIFVFRHCRSCATVNLIKDGIFECALCGTTLSRGE